MPRKQIKLSVQQEEAQTKWKLKHLRSLVKEGFDATDRGEFEMLTDAKLKQFLDDLRITKREAI